MKRYVSDGILHICSDDGTVFLAISEIQKDGILEMICAGEIRNEAAIELKDELLALLSINDNVRVNLQNVDYIASSALSCFLTVQRTADEYKKGGLILTALSDPVAAAFKQTGLQEILLIDPAASIASPEDLKRASRICIPETGLL